MWSLAVSLGSILLTTCGGQVGVEVPLRIERTPQAFQSADRQDQAFRKLLPSLATIEIGAVPVGQAALISRDGLFIAHKSSVPSDRVEAKLIDGSTVQMRVLQRETLTQLVLLQADGWAADRARPVEVPTGDIDPGTPLLVALATGSVPGVFSNNELAGVIRPSNRLVPLSEIRFEAPVDSCAGALVFTREGGFVGALSATLARRDTSAPSPLNGGALGLGGIARSTILSPAKSLANYGPAPMTIAYTPGVDLLRQTLDGLRSPAHVVERPSLGISCSNNVGGGALVQEVVANSAAQRAGVQRGDVLVGIGQYRIRNQVDFAKVVLRLVPGSKTTLFLKRGRGAVVQDVLVGKTSD